MSTSRSAGFASTSRIRSRSSAHALAVGLCAGSICNVTPMSSATESTPLGIHASFWSLHASERTSSATDPAEEVSANRQGLRAKSWHAVMPLLQMSAAGATIPTRSSCSGAR